MLKVRVFWEYGGVSEFYCDDDEYHKLSANPNVSTIRIVGSPEETKNLMVLDMERAIRVISGVVESVKDQRDKGMVNDSYVNGYEQAVENVMMILREFEE